METSESSFHGRSQVTANDVTHKRCSEFFKEDSLPLPKFCKSKTKDKAIVGVLRDLLREQWARREENPTPIPAFDAALRDSMQTLRSKSDEIETVRKERVFDSEVTEEEMDIIAKRVALQQRQFQEYQKREALKRIARIKIMFPYLSDHEISEALNETHDDEEMVILNFTQIGYLNKIRKAIALRYDQTPKSISKELTDEQKEAYVKLLEKRRNMLKKTTASDLKKKNVRFVRLRLDDALAQLKKGDDPEKIFEGWSNARIRAYQQIETKPNSYYYRFNAPGEKQRNGPWTEEERDLFFKRLDEMGAEGQWGIFAMAIPGRVGYQCSNYYRHLVKTGEIKDENYVIDEAGELRYLFGKKEGGQGVIRTHIKYSFHVDGNPPPHARKKKGSNSAAGGASKSVGPKKSARPPVAMAQVSQKNKKKRKSRYGSEEEEDSEDNYSELCDKDDSGTFSLKSSTRRQQQSAEPDDIIPEFNPNPLPGFTDPITLDEVVKPAISPYGHVMGYDNWLRCLNSEDRKNICPITKKPLSKRELVVLTHDNIEEYRNRIVNM